MDILGIVTAILILALVGFLVYLVITYIPMPEPFKQAIVVAVVVLLILWLITLVAGGTHLPALRRG